MINANANLFLLKEPESSTKVWDDRNDLVYILDSKRNAYYPISILYQKLLSNFTLNNMNMFERSHAFVPDHFFRHYKVNFYFLLINAKTQKQCRTLEKTWFESDVIACHENIMKHIRKQHKTLKFIGVGFILLIQKIFIFAFFALVLQTTGIFGV